MKRAVYIASVAFSVFILLAPPAAETATAAAPLDGDRAPSGGPAPGAPEAGISAIQFSDFDSITPKTPGTYEHVGRLFVLRYPKDWDLSRVIAHGALGYMVMSGDGFAQVSVVPRPDTAQAEDPVAALKQMTPALKMGLRAMGGAKLEAHPSGADKIVKDKLGELDAARLVVEGKMGTDTFTMEFTVALDGPVAFVLTTAVATEDYAKAQPAFQAIRRESQFGRPRPKRLAHALVPGDVAAKYKGSVVSVRASDGKGGDESTGTGFLISKQGYLLTNDHVIWDEAAGRPYPNIIVEWDQMLKRKPAAATLVGCRRAPSEFSIQHGVDIALLKIAPGDYEPLPLTPLSEVREDDPVLTMGFPRRDKFPDLSMTRTHGYVARFNRGLDGEVDSILIDAAIEGGNSGGPCINLVTGGVMGVNTFRYPWMSKCGGVEPIDFFLREWPLITQLGLPPDGSTLDFFEAYDLMALYWHVPSMGSPAAAATLARRAVACKPDSASAQLLLALCLKKELDEPAPTSEAERIGREITAALEKALSIDGKNFAALEQMALWMQETSHPEKAVELADRAVKADPTGGANYLRASIAFKQQDYAAARKYVDLAKKVALELKLWPAPYVLSGEIHYQAGNLDPGRDDYVEASRIDPFNLDARLGVAEYYRWKKDPKGEMAEYEKILADFPGNPTVLSWMGSCAYNAGRLDDAVAHFRQAFRTYRKMSKPVPERPLGQMGLAMAALNRDPPVALGLLAEYLSDYSSGPRALDVHMALMRVAVSNHLPGLAGVQKTWAEGLPGGKAGLPDWARQLAPVRLGLDEIKSAVKMGYPVPLLSTLVRRASLDFAVRTKDQASALLEELRAAARDEDDALALAMAIVDSQKRADDEAKSGKETREEERRALERLFRRTNDLRRSRPDFARSASRNWFAPVSRDGYTGFRAARNP